MPQPQQQQQPDPWEQAAQAYKAGGGTAIQPSATQKPGEDWKVWQAQDPPETAKAQPPEGMLDQIADWGAKTFPHVSAADEAKEGRDFGTMLPQPIDRFVSNAGNGLVRKLTAVPAGMASAAEGLFNPDTWTPAAHQKEQQQEIGNARNNGTLRVFAPGQTPPEPNAEDYSDYGANLASDAGLAYLTGKTVDGALHFPSKIKTRLTGDLDEPMGAGDISPRERYQIAKGMGVQPTAADATNNPFLRGLTDVNERTLRGAPVHQAARNANLDALDKYTTGYLDELSPYDPETGGQAIQEPLRQDFNDLQDRAHDTLSEFSPLEGEAGGADLQGRSKAAMDKLHEEATEGYKDVSDNYGDMPANNSAQIVRTAEDIGKKNARFGQQFPSLESRKIMGVVGDAAQLGGADQVRHMGAPTVSDLIRSRSALLDLTRDPEIVKSSYGAYVQRLIAAHDQAIMDSLPTDGQEAWRGANAKWESMKNTFDNPSNPFYHAIRTDTPSTLTRGIGGTSPEAVKSLRKIMGPTGSAIVARGVTEDLLGDKPGVGYDLGGFARRLGRMPDDNRLALFGPRGNEELDGLGRDYREMQPFEQAAYSEDPESLTQGIGLGPQTAAGVRKLREIPVKPEGAFGPPAPRVGEQGIGALRRGVATKLLGTTADGGFNFPRLAGNVERLNPGYRAELFGNREQPLRDIGRVGRMLTENSNRSGTGGVNIKEGEIGGIMNFADPKSALSKIGGTVAQRSLAKRLTLPSKVDWLMRAPWRPNPFYAPAAGPAAGLAALGAAKRPYPTKQTGMPSS